MFLLVQNLQVPSLNRSQPSGTHLPLWVSQLCHRRNTRHERSHHSLGLWNFAGPLQLLQPHPRRNARHFVDQSQYRVSLQFIAFIAEAIVFVYLGLSMINYFSEEAFSISFIGLQILITFIARFGTVFGLSLIFRLCMKWHVYNSELAVISTAGTIKGSVAFALILSVDIDKHPKNQLSIIKSTVLILVSLTTIVLGGIMPKLIKFFMGSRTKET